MHLFGLRLGPFGWAITAMTLSTTWTPSWDMNLDSIAISCAEFRSGAWRAVDSGRLRSSVDL